MTEILHKYCKECGNLFTVSNLEKEHKVEYLCRKDVHYPVIKVGNIKVLSIKERK